MMSGKDVVRERERGVGNGRSVDRWARVRGVWMLLGRPRFRHRGTNRGGRWVEIAAIRPQ